MLKHHREKFAYLWIAVAVLLFSRTLLHARHMPLTDVLLYASVAASLLAGNVPRVVDLPLHYAYPVRCIELFTFGVALVCLFAFCLRRLWT